MELRQFAERILCAESLEEKLAPLAGSPTDHARGISWRPPLPGRPPELIISPRRMAPAMPTAAALADPRKRGLAHHIMANHELQAVEVMAFVLCAFPEAPSEFRLGLARILGDEQRHTRMHAERAGELGVPFGSRPVNGHFWKQTAKFESLLDYLATLPLVFEQGNLDHTLQFERLFLLHGDRKGAGILRAIHRDEIEHVRFGWEWFSRLRRGDGSASAEWAARLPWPLRAEKARGPRFHREPRAAAGLPPELIDLVERASG